MTVKDNDSIGSDWFWGIIENSQKDAEKLRKQLIKMSKSEVYNFQKEFVEASVELQVPPFTDFMEESEDGAEDVSHWVVSQGKKVYDEILNNPQSIPHFVDEDDPEILYGIAAEVFRERFGELIGIYG